MKRLLIIGPPCVGKSTMSALLSAHFEVPLLLNSISADTKKEFFNSKQPLDIEYWKILKSALYSLPSDSGFIISGYPRSMTQLIILELNSVPFDFILILQQPEDLITKKALKRKICEPCCKSFSNEEFIFQDFHLKNIHPEVESHCPVCDTILTARKDDNFRSVKKRFFEFSVFLSSLKSSAHFKEKLIFFDLFKGVDDLPRLISTIHSNYEKISGNKDT